MRAIGATLWVSAVLFELGACEPRVSVGDLGAAGAGDAAGTGGASATVAGSSQGGTSLAGQSGSKVTGGGGETSKAGGPAMSAGGKSVVSEGGAPPDNGGDDGAGGDDYLGCLAGFTHALPPVAVECPEAAPTSGDACDDIPENAICVWQTGIVGQGNVGYEVRGCYSAIGGKKWYGVGQGNEGPVGVDPQHCPDALPKAGSSCTGHSGENCYFPQAACACASDAAKWSCTENPKPNLVPAPVERLCPPDGIDEATAIKDLSGPEIETWCSWYGGGGRPRPPVTGTDAPGYATSYPTSWGHIGAEVCLMDLPVDLCIKNILLHQSCTATLEQLDDCVESIRAWPGGAWVGHGCGPLLSNPTCARLIVQQVPSGSAADCKVPVAEDAD